MWPPDLLAIETPTWLLRWTALEAVLALVALALVGALIGATMEIRGLHAQLMQAWQALGQEQKIRRELLDDRDAQRKRHEALRDRLNEVRELAAAYNLLGPIGPLLDGLRDDMTEFDRIRQEGPPDD